MHQDSLDFLTALGGRHILHQVVDNLTPGAKAVIIVQNAEGENAFLSWNASSDEAQQMIQSAYWGAQNPQTS